MVDAPNIPQNFGRPSYRPAAPGGMDPDMRRMAFVAVGLGGVVALTIGGISLSHRAHHSIPVVEAVPGPVRVRPLNPGGMTVAGAEDPVSGVEALAPASEKPAFRALRAKTHAASAVSHPAVSVPAAQPAPTLAAPAIGSPAIGSPAMVSPTPPPPAAVTQAAPATASPPTGNVVQLAVFDTQQAAEQDWGTMAAKMPGVFDGRHPEVARAQVVGRTVYRLRTGGFASIAAATDFCGKVRAMGGDCSIAAF